MRPDSVLLTIAIPTFNRADRLDLALSILVPQLRGHSEVELIISDNCSEDGTEEVARGYLDAAQPNIVYRRQERNIGADANFLSCLGAARGRYFWLCGDDDIIIAGGLDRVLDHLGGPAEYDMIYATGYSFLENHIAEFQGDGFQRSFHVFTDAVDFCKVVNIMFTFVSTIIVNRERLMALPHEPFANFAGTLMGQLSWRLPLLRQHRRSLIIWDRVVAARCGNAGGYSFGAIWGESLSSTVRRLLPDRPELVDAILNSALRRWFPDAIYDLRSQDNKRCKMEDIPQLLRQTYGRNPRYWLFTYPVIALPLPLAKAWARGTATFSKALYLIRSPGVLRKRIRAS